MAKVPNAVEILPKSSTACVGCTSVRDRQTTDGRATAISERRREFTFAKNWTDLDVGLGRNATKYEYSLGAVTAQRTHSFGVTGGLNVFLLYFLSKDVFA